MKIIIIDDYHIDNLRIASLLKDYGLEKDTWFAIQLNNTNSAGQIEALHKMGFNLASHTVMHAYLNEIPSDKAYWELEESKRIIDNITGKDTDWLVWPRGRYTPDNIRQARKCGYKYARTTKLYDGQTDYEKGGNHLSYPRKEYGGVDPFEWAKKSKLQCYWFHVSEINTFGLQDKLVDFLEWYKNNMEVR